MDVAKISVIVPVYNVKKYLEQCINSVLNQTYPNWELILIDDAASDGSAELCDKAALKDKRIIVIHNEENQGVSQSRNTGLNIASGDLILFLDSDDFIAENLLELAVRYINERNLDIFIYKYKAFEETQDIILIDNSAEKEMYNSEQAIKEVLDGRKFRGICWNKVCRKEIYENIRFPQNRRYGEDIYVTYRLLHSAKRIMFVHKELYFYRIHENSAMHGVIYKDVFTRVVAYEEFIEWIEEHYSYLSDLAYKAYCNITAETTLMLKNAEKTTRKVVMENIHNSVKNRINKIICRNKISSTTKAYMKLYGLTSHMYRFTSVYMLYKRRKDLYSMAKGKIYNIIKENINLHRRRR